MILVTRRVLTPSIYMVAMADFRTLSLRDPFSKRAGAEGFTTASDLRNRKGEGADPSLEIMGLENVGVARYTRN